jgi:hypothetical protein
MDSASCQDDGHDALNDGEQCQPPKPGSAYPPAASEPTHWPLSYPPSKNTKRCTIPSPRAESGHTNTSPVQTDTPKKHRRVGSYVMYAASLLQGQRCPTKVNEVVVAFAGTLNVASWRV